MIQKLFFVTLSLLLLASPSFAEEADFEKIALDKNAIKKEAAEKTQSAQDELLKLEQAVGEQAAPSTSPVTKDAASAKPWLPAAKEFDWVQLTSGEWLKGEIKSMYNDNLEFDSDKLDLLSIAWEDVKYLKSYRPSSINIENHEPVTGSLQISGDEITITDGDDVQLFRRADLISLTPSGEREADLWALKFNLGLNVRSGNTDQLDYTSKFNAKRRTAKSRFVLDYIGNISQTGSGSGDLVETVNNNRLSGSHNIYATRYFFYTPVFAEYFRDKFQNINKRITVGLGLGYTIFDTGKLEWHVNGGPAFLTTKYDSVQPGQAQMVDTAALVLGTDFEAELTSALDFIFKYNIQASEKKAGGYAHSMIATFESEITGSLDFDISMIWDRISQPATDENGVSPEPDDYRLTVGVTYTY